MLRLTQKEIKRQSTDGYVIISRPAKPLGGYHVMCVRVETGLSVGWARHVSDKEAIAAAATSINRDLNKFLGIGGDMASAGRTRPVLKENRAKAVEIAGGGSKFL